MKKLVITGATGLIGKALCKTLANDYEIIAITRNHVKASAVLGNQIKTVSWGNKKNLIDAVNGAWGIINLAGENISSRPWTKKQQQKILDSRVGPIEGLKEALMAPTDKPAFFFQMSAIGYYSNSLTRVYTEKTTCSNSAFLHRVVVQWEEAAASIMRDHTRSIIGRCGVVLDAWGGAFPKMAMPFKLFAGGPIGHGKQWVSWVHINDLVDAIVFLMENKQSEGIYNLTSPNPATNSEFGRQLAHLMKRPYWLTTPAWLLKLIFGKMAKETLLASQYVVPKRLVEDGFKYTYETIDEALQDLLKHKK